MLLTDNQPGLVYRWQISRLNDGQADTMVGAEKDAYYQESDEH